VLKFFLCVYIHKIIKIIIQRLEAINSDDLLKKSRNQGWFIEKRYNSDGLFKKVIIRGGLLRKGITVMVYLKQVINSSGLLKKVIIRDGLLKKVIIRFGFMVFHATFNNISVISWQSVLLVEETRLPGENHRPVATLSHNCCIEYTSP
jgi:hypothetical protein